MTFNPLSLSTFQDYCASKFGAVGFHESLTHELQVEGLDGIKTTLVCPYIVDTGMFAGCEIRQDTSMTGRCIYVLVALIQNNYNTCHVHYMVNCMWTLIRSVYGHLLVEPHSKTIGLHMEVDPTWFP